LYERIQWSINHFKVKSKLTVDEVLAEKKEPPTEAVASAGLISELKANETNENRLHPDVKRKARVKKQQQAAVASSSFSSTDTRPARFRKTIEIFDHLKVEKEELDVSLELYRGLLKEKPSTAYKTSLSSSASNTNLATVGSTGRKKSLRPPNEGLK
jgi:hypothetical protein